MLPTVINGNNKTIEKMFDTIYDEDTNTIRVSLSVDDGYVSAMNGSFASLNAGELILSKEGVESLYKELQSVSDGNVKEIEQLSKDVQQRLQSQSELIENLQSRNLALEKNEQLLVKTIEALKRDILLLKQSYDEVKSDLEVLRNDFNYKK